MTSSMDAAVDTRKAERAECTEPESGVHLLGSTRPTTELPVVRGFIVVDRHGEFLSWAEGIEAAVRRSRELDGAHQVLRCADGEVMAFRPRAFKAVRT